MNLDKKNRLKFTVLMISDDLQTQNLLTDSIAGDDFEMSIVGTVKEALTIIESEFFSIIFIDHILNGLDQFCNTLNQKNGKQNYFSILITNIKDINSKYEPAINIDDYMFRPLSKFMIKNILNNARRHVLYAAGKKNSEGQLKTIINELEETRNEQIRLEAQLKEFTESRYIETGKLEAIGRMSAGIAHEINTPVQYVGDNIHFLRDSFEEISHLLKSYKTMYQTLREGKTAENCIREIDSLLLIFDLEYLEEEIPETIRQSMEGLDRISGIVLAMRNLSSSGKDDKATVKVNEAIKNTITLTRNEWKYVAEIKTDFDEKLANVACHPGEFNQVILNMIVNAAHAVREFVNNMPQQKGVIEISTEKIKNKALICIRDTGVGIPENIKMKIFDPFFTTKEAGQGTGQGLAISKSVIKTYDGDITFDSKPGKGTVFIITLPVCDKNVTPSISLQPSIPQFLETSTTKKHILFVDDDPDILKGLERMLHHLRKEWEMVFTENASQALSKLEQKPFDVIVTDCRMSGSASNLPTRRRDRFTGKVKREYSRSLFYFHVNF